MIHKYITGSTAVKIAAGIEQAIRENTLKAGQRLPSVRELAQDLEVNPATVAAAYKSLQARAIVNSQGRLGTRVTHRPLVPPNRQQPVVHHRSTINLADGNPDPALLPPLQHLLRRIRYTPHLYGEPMMHEGLINIMRQSMKRDGVMRGNERCCVVNGTMDGLDRLFAEHFRPGDRIAVEDPGFSGHHDLVASRGLTLVPVAIDELGMLPDALEQACRRGLHGVLITPRAQSPTGAALTADRARSLRRAMSVSRGKKKSDVLVIEDDHASFLTETVGYEPVHEANRSDQRWVHLRSLSKSFNPDLRLAVMTGDDFTITRLLDRLVVVERWVSHIVQTVAYELLADKTARAAVRQAAKTYDQRRTALLDALARVGCSATGRSGYNVWLHVQEETTTVQGLLQRGWAVAPGERFRLGSSPGVRITASRMQPRDSQRFAMDVREVLNSKATNAHV